MYMLLKIKLCCFALIVLISCQTVSAQIDLSTDISPRKGIFKLTNEQAHQVLNGRTLLDSLFYSDLQFIYNIEAEDSILHTLPHGYYLNVTVANNKLLSEFVAVNNVELHLLNNTQDFIFSLNDVQGKPITTAKAKLKHKQVKFDENLQAYVRKRSNKQGLLTIEYDGVENYFQIERHYDRGNFVRNWNRIVYKRPISIVYRPIHFVVSLPIDAGKSIKHRRAYGVYSRIARPFRDVKQSRYGSPSGWIKKTACLFAPGADYCKDRSVDYLITNKPKYKLGETVHFKAQAAKQGSNRPLKQNLKVQLFDVGDYRHKKVADFGTLEAYHLGAFVDSFVLADSFQLKNDRRYEIRLVGRRNHIWASGDFYIEDYTFQNTRLASELLTEKVYHGDSISIMLKGEDVSKQAAFDLRYEIELHFKDGSEEAFFDKSVLIPNLLYSESGKFSKEKLVNIATSEFPKSNFDIEAKVRIWDAENELKEFNYKVAYNYLVDEIEFELIKDSLQLAFNRNGISIAQEVDVVLNYKRGVGLSQNQIQLELPVALPVDESITSIDILKDGAKIKHVRLKNEFNYGDVNARWNRTADSIFIKIDNPNKKPVHYFFYSKRKTIEEGFVESDFSKNFKALGKQNYYLILRYKDGNKIKKDNYNIALKDRQLKVTTNLPKSIYPGQTADVEVTVENYKGKPIKNYDLTGFAYNSKFKTSAPSLPEVDKKRKEKQLINTFSSRQKSKQLRHSQSLDYEEWKSTLELDTLQMYQLRYPKKKLTYFIDEVADSVTQFAPFVVDNGKLITPSIVLLNGMPCYYDMVKHPLPYSFKVDTSKQRNMLVLRLEDTQIFLKDVEFKTGVKNILIIDKSQLDSTEFASRPRTMLDWEYDIATKYIFSYRSRLKSHIEFLKGADEYVLLNGISLNNTTGPVISKNLEFINPYDTIFFNHEPNFEYDFGRNIIKMRQYNKPLIDTILSNNFSPDQLNQYYLTKEKMERYIFVSDSLYNHSSYTWHYKKYSSFDSYDLKWNTGDLRVEFADSILPDSIINTIIVNQDDKSVFAIYPKLKVDFSWMPEGRYKLFFVTSDVVFETGDAIEVVANSLHLLKYEKPLIRDSKYSTNLLHFLKGLELSTKKYYNVLPESEEDFKQVIRYEEYQYYGPTRRVCGTVKDEGNKESLIGVNVFEKGTTNGSVTDIDGNFCLDIAYGGTLVFSYVGYESLEVVNPTGKHQVYEMNEGQMLFEEVVVAASGYSKGERNVSASVQSIKGSELKYNNGTSNNKQNLSAIEVLRGKLAGMSIQNGSASASGDVIIRGAGSFSNQILVVIDGVPINLDEEVYVDYAAALQLLDANAIQNVSFLKGAEAAALYGSRGANGVLIVKTNPDADFKLPEELQPKPKPEIQMEASGLRSNFKDFAMWQPQLRTNKNGKVSFKTTLSDNITSWDAYFVGLDRKKRYANYRSTISSSKSLIARLNLPQFFVEGDKLTVSGQRINYTANILSASIEFKENDQVLYQQQSTFKDSEVDRFEIQLLGDKDTVQYTYKVRLPENNYVDGEQKQIPVLKKGLMTPKGIYAKLDGDTTFNIKDIPDGTKMKLYVDDLFDGAFAYEVAYLKNYKHLCNEQASSKLIAYLLDRKLKLNQVQQYEHDVDIVELIKHIEKGMNSDWLWGWWANGRFAPWVNTQVVRALKLAEQQDFEVPDLYPNQVALLAELLKSGNADSYRKLNILKTLHLLEAELNFGQYLDSVQFDSTNINKNLELAAFRATLDLPFDTSMVDKNIRHDIYGNTYFKGRYNYLPSSSFLMANLYGYQILEKLGDKRAIEVLQFVASSRANRYSINTYVASTLLINLVDKLGALMNTRSSISIAGDYQIDTDKFPIEATFDYAKGLQVQKLGGMPLYFSCTYEAFVSTPSAYDSLFNVTTYVEDGEAMQQIENGISLKVGEPIELKVQVDAKYDAEYLMLTIPIPSSCNYMDKKQFWNESHREYFKDKTIIYIKKLSKGKHEYTINLLPKFNGTFVLNPAKIESMYFPKLYGNNEVEEISVK